MRLRPVVLAVGVAICAAPLAGQNASIISTVPVVAHTAGIGNPPTYWVSDLTIHNPTDSRITAALVFLPEGVAGDPAHLSPQLVQLYPHETVFYPDVLATRFGITGNVKGVIMVDCGYIVTALPNPQGSKLLVTSRTYNTGDPRGTFGQTVTSAQLFINFYSDAASVTGVRHDARYRSNLGIFNISPQPVSIDWAARRPDGSTLTSGTLSLSEFTMRQWSFATLGIPVQSQVLTIDLGLAAADVSQDPCAALFANGFIAYVSKVDGNPDGTGDAEMLFAVPARIPSCWIDLMF